MTTGTAESRALRTLAVLFGVATCAFTALGAGAVVAQWSAVPAGWTLAMLAASTVPGIALAAAAPTAPIRAVQVLAVVAAVASFLVTALVPTAFPRSGPGGPPPWPIVLTVLGTTAVALLGRAGLARAAVVLAAGLVGAARLLVARTPDPVAALQDAGISLFVDAVFAALVFGALDAGRRIDAAEAAATAAAVDAAVERVREDERMRVDALVHDRVLTTLLSAGRGSQDARGVESQAADALRDLRALADGTPVPAPEDRLDLVGRIRAATTALAPAADLRDGTVGPAPVLPEAVVDALLSAVAEALRNAVRHAPDAEVVVQVHGRTAAMEIAVVDDGPGFDPGAVPAGRLGIAASIVDRMRAAGGEAEVRSRPGQGTAVRITWPR